MGADAMLAERGKVAVNCEELDELRSLAASGSDSAELAQETADLIALLHQARSSNASVSALQHSWHVWYVLYLYIHAQPSSMIKLDGLGQYACFANYLHACIQYSV